MSLRWTIPAETVAAQRKASNPAHSAWVRANAGSGKTHVLAHRVVRLLLDGSEPSKILCLTFTKAAAANMSMRVFALLSKWTAMDDDALRADLRDMGVTGAVDLDAARQLFARAVETPGGLKIQTIHAFCERILHLFPFEANVPARFEALDEEQQALLMEEARADMLQTAAQTPESKLAAALELVAGEASGPTFDGLLREALSKRAALRAASRHQADGLMRALGGHLGLAPGETLAQVEDGILNRGIPESRWREMLEALDASGGNDRKLAQHYRSSLSADKTADRIDTYLRIFCTDKGEPRAARNGRFLNKSIAASVENDFADEHRRIGPLIDKLKAARVTAQSAALHLLCDEVLNNYARLKQARGYLDFEDLIERTSNLLSRSNAGWVLYKLDAGIDHILVDEAQDTSPQQWDILKALAEEFFSGAGARPGHRTFFAVGDEKQSIFSFQGARPREFGANAKAFGRKIAAAQLAFEDVRLKTSFRSAGEILDSVDIVFGAPENFAGLSADDEVQTVHTVLKTDLPGLVEIWEPVGPQPSVEPEDWKMPVDALSEGAPPSVLARRIAQKIRTLLHPQSREAVHDEKGRKRPVRAGDIMILVRRRDAFFEAVIRALKVAGIPVAGADRLKLMDHIAVMDLVAAGRAALLPQDDFTLACVLKSPLFGFDDDDLMALAPGRKTPLLARLQTSPDPRHAPAFARIVEWGAAARALGPFRFYASLLNAQGGRRAILARLGAEAGDAIDEFLRLALQWERSETPSLTAFLHRMQGAEIEIKRDLEAAGEAVRVMTVHAAKGLEGKIVFLPDTCSTPAARFDPNIVEIGAESEKLPVWKRRKKDNPQAVQDAIDAFRAEQAAEYRRLLYVAMTRAEERLYIAGHCGAKGPAPGSWREMIERTLAPRGERIPAPWGEGEIVRIGEPALLADAASAQDAPASPAAAPPPWLWTPAPQEAPPAPPIRPSHALGAADQFEPAGENAPPGRDQALLAGTLSHTLLQYLPDVPAAQRAEAAARFLASRGGKLDAASRETLARQALAVVSDPRLAPLFGPQSRAEVAIAGRIAAKSGDPIEIAGRIDRLGVSDDAIHIADFKTGLVPTETGVPRRHIAQMALYRAALAPLFPGKTLRAWIVWTNGPRISELEDAALDAALYTLTA